MGSREDILGRVRGHLGRTAENAVPATTEIDAWLAERQQGPRPSVDAAPAAMLERFRVKSESYESTVDVVAASDEVPAAIARYLAGLQLVPRAVCWQALASLPWAAAGMTIEARGAVDADLVGITGCFCAIAETGTLMLLSSAGTPATVSLLPETHVAVVPASRIVPGMEEAWGRARSECGALPRAVNFVSGPSRTGDIEQTIVLGAHGPYRVHIVVVAGE